MAENILLFPSMSRTLIEGKENVYLDLNGRLILVSPNEI